MKEILSFSNDKFSIALSLSDDEQKVFLNASTPSRGYVSRADLEQAIGTLIPSDLLHTAVLTDIAAQLSKGEEVKERRIAKGSEPVPGNPGKLVFLVKRFVDPSKKRAPEEEPGPSLRDLHLFDNIRAGTIVARVYPPKPGQEGRTALGTPIKTSPAPAAAFKLDKSLELKPESHGEPFKTIVANSDGYLLEESGNLSIQSELVVKGNVDFHVGNLDFVGSILVKGDVLPGFAVRAEKAVNVQGSVQGGVVQSRFSDVTVKQLIFGGESGQVLAGGSVTCATARQAHIESVGNIVVSKEAVGCILRTQGAVLAERAKVIGGMLRTVCGADMLQFGNEVGTASTLELCSNIEMTTDYITLVASIASHRKAKELIELHLGPYAKQSSRLSLLTGAVRARIEALLTKKKDVEQSLVQLLATQQTMLEGARVAQTLRCNIRKVFHAGSRIVAGEHIFAPADAVQGPASIEFNMSDKTFTVGELKALECVLAPRTESTT
jgi:uncharacterized protein (DUF342 family)